MISLKLSIASSAYTDVSRLNIPLKFSSIFSFPSTLGAAFPRGNRRAGTKTERVDTDDGDVFDVHCGTPLMYGLWVKAANVTRLSNNPNCTRLGYGNSPFLSWLFCKHSIPSSIGCRCLRNLHAAQ